MKLRAQYKLEILALVGLIFIAYSNVFDMAFVYDDEFYIQKNQYLSSFDHIADIFSSNSTAGAGFKDSFYRPIQFSFYLLIQQTFGDDPFGFHLLNVVIHICNGILLYLLCLQLFNKRWIAFFVALFWGVHPVHTEVVAYISGTADPLQGFFTLSALNIILKYKGRGIYIGAFLCLIGFLSKEVAIVFPGILCALLFIKEEQRWKIKTYYKAIPYLLLAIAYVLLRKTVLNFNGDFEFYKDQNIYTENIIFRIYTFLATLPNYFELLVWPSGLHIDRHFPVYASFFLTPVLIGTVMVLMAMFNMFWLWKKNSPYAIWSIGATLWFAAAHSLHSGILMPMNSFFLEHWLYMPSIAFFFLIGAGLNAFSKNIPRNALLVLCSGAALLLALQTHQQNRMWESPMTLFSTILRYNPTATRVRHNLAMAYSDGGQDEKALAEYQKILNEDVRPYPQTHHNMALIYLRQNRLDLGEAHLLKALEVSPQFFPSYPYLIKLYQEQGKANQAKEWQEKLKRLSP